MKRWSRGAKKIFSSRNSDPKGRWVNLKSGWHPARTHVAMVLFSTYSFCYIFYIWQLLLKAPMNGSFINEVKLVSTEYSQWNMTFTSQVNHIIRFFSFLIYLKSAILQVPCIHWQVMEEMEHPVSWRLLNQNYISCHISFDVNALIKIRKRQLQALSNMQTEKKSILKGDAMFSY